MGKKFKKAAAKCFLPWVAWAITSLSYSDKLSRFLDKLLLAAEDET